MTRLSAFALGAALCASLTAPAVAQDVVDAVERDRRGDIVVEGDRIVDGEEVGRLGRDITPRPSTSQDPLARFQRPICPGVWGLSPENAQLVIDRMYDNAERAGVDINEDPECGANVWVIFVDDPQETFQQLRDENAFLVRGLDYWKRKAVTEQEGPVLAWNVIGIYNEEGMPVASPSETAAAATDARALGDGIPGNTVTTMSRTRTAIRQDIELSVMLVQRSAIAGLDAVALGDYATMRTLAQTRPPRRENAYDTVLTLFDEDDVSPPDRLTDFDLAYLQSLYSSREDRPSRMALRNVDELMEIEARAEE
ncbi:hypothetical protein [Aurantiacibacter gilvus]|uniref:DUF2927 domain-containing protein n=1 Tax=Aurantiacibacter gilvus TaxID=3139141 RepID=A0ABU9IFI9_9SPHN